MRLIRQITYEGTEEALRHQMQHSVQDGEHRFNPSIVITISTAEVAEKGVERIEGQRPDGWWRSERGPNAA